MPRQPPPLVPPLRFSQVEEGVYRGAYPSLVNHRFLTRLRLRTIVSLLPEEPTPDLLRWCERNVVENHAVVVLPFKKDEVTLSHEQAAELLQLLVTPERQPIYVHCLDGVTVTGTLIMCLRKLQRWAMPPIVAEYSRFDRRRGDVCSRASQPVGRPAAPPLTVPRGACPTAATVPAGGAHPAVPPLVQPGDAGGTAPGRPAWAGCLSALSLTGARPSARLRHRQVVPLLSERLPTWLALSLQLVEVPPP